MTKCAVLFCKNYSGRTTNVSFHPFPTDPARKRKWVESVRRERTWIPTKHHRICSVHFESKCYNEKSTKQRKLIKDSFPTLRLPEFCFVTSGMHLLLMATGIALSYPSVLAPALADDRCEIKVTQDELQTILGVYGLTGPIGFVCFPWIMQRFGRKVINIVFGVNIILGSIAIAVARDATLLIIGRGIHGLSLTGYFISCIIAAEYTHPRRRGFHIAFKGVSGGIGELLCHSLGLTILTYQQTALLVVIPAILSILITLKWPESPQYLAYKGRYEECTAAFEWIRGTDSEAKKELQELILAQKERKKIRIDFKDKARETIRSKGFWKLMLILFCSSVTCQFSGFLFMASYVNEIITMITGDRYNAFYYTLVLDTFRILSIFVSSVLIRLAKRKTVLFSSGIFGCILMATIFTTNHYKDVKWVTSFTTALFVVYYIIVNVAIAPVAIVMQGEIVPLKYKGIGTFLCGLIMTFLGFLVLSGTWKLIPLLEIHGVFGVYSVVCAIFYLILYFFLPETKDRTLQDIETEFVVRNVDYTGVPSDIIINKDN